MKYTLKRLTAICLCAALCVSLLPLWATAATTVPGDVSGNGSVDMYDALVVYNYVAGMLDLTPEQQAAADISGDGRVGLQDAVTVFYKALHLIEDEPAPTTTTTKATTTTTKATTTTTKATTTTTKATTTTTKAITTTTKAITTTTTTKTTTTTTTTTTQPHVTVRSGVTNESVYMSDIKVKNETTGKTFTAETKTKLQMAVAEIVKYEMGMSTFGEKSDEAWKAMAVAAYTELAHYCYGGYTYSIQMSEDIDLTQTTDKRIYDAVGKVLGIKIAYNDSSLPAFDQLCEVFYGASNAGVTCSTYNVWGETDLEYIPVVESKYDNAEWIAHCSAGIDSFEHTFTIPISELKECIADYMEVDVSRVGYDKKTGQYSLYATEKEGPYWGKSNFYYTRSDGTKRYMSGVDLYYAINWYHPTIHCYSHAITVTAEKNGSVTVKTKGNGHGLGLSQYGAAGYANEAGWTYDQILAHYYGITATTKWGLVGPKW